MDGLWWKTLLKWMIWGYHYFRKHPFEISTGNIREIGSHSVSNTCTVIETTTMQNLNEYIFSTKIETVLIFWEGLIPYIFWFRKFVEIPHGAKLHKKKLVRNIRAYKSLKPHIRLNHDTSPTRILCNPVDSLEMSHLRPLQFDLTGLMRASFPGNNMNAWMQLPSSKLT